MSKYQPTIEEALVSPETWATRQQNWKKMGIDNPPSREEYRALLKQAEDKCPVCGRSPGARGFHLHHNHETHEWIGLVCGRCNQGMGQFNDNPYLLMKAAQYILDEQAYIATKDYLGSIYEDLEYLGNKDMIEDINLPYPTTSAGTWGNLHCMYPRQIPNSTLDRMGEE